MHGETAQHIVFSIPRKHWLPIFVVAAITTVVVFKFTTDAVISISGTYRQSTPPDDVEQPESSGEQTVETTDDAIAKSESDAAAEPVNVAVHPRVPEAPLSPQDRMVPESLLHLMVENLNKKDEMWGKLLAQRDVQITQLTRQVSDLQDQLNGQQQQLAEIRGEQVQQAWATVDRFHEQQASGIHGRTNNFAIPEQNGLPATPVSRQTVQSAADDPFDRFATPTSSRVTSPRTSPRRGYINVNPTRSNSSDGPTAGSAKRRIENQARQHQSAVDWTRKYHNRSGSSRVLSEMEAENR